MLAKDAGCESDADLAPGDLAIVNKRTHVLVYLGDGAWIEAAPEAQEVIVHDSPCKKRRWMETDAVLLRWRELAEGR